jgi:hypothetical protein
MGKRHQFSIEKIEGQELNGAVSVYFGHEAAVGLQHAVIGKKGAGLCKR